MLLVIGDSFAFWAGRRCSFEGDVRTAGWRGGRISDGEFRRWAVATVMDMRPRTVALIVGGNDTAGDTFNTRLLSSLYWELTLGFAAAVAQRTVVFPIPPRTAQRPDGASTSVYRRRRRLLNMVLRRQFSRPDACPQAGFASFCPDDIF